MRNNYVLIALAGLAAYLIYNKMRKAAPITTAALPTQPLMPIAPSGVNTRPTNGNSNTSGGGRPNNGNDGSPGGGRPGIL